MATSVRTVDSVHLSVVRASEVALVFTAGGTVSSTGWENGRLEPRYYFEFPADGIQDFDFIADPPSGMTLMIIVPISSTPYHWTNPPEFLKGIRIHSASNSVETLISQASMVPLMK